MTLKVGPNTKYVQTIITCRGNDALSSSLFLHPFTLLQNSPSNSAKGCRGSIVLSHSEDWGRAPTAHSFLVYLEPKECAQWLQMF